MLLDGVISGTLDGAGYSIYNLRVSQPGEDTAVTVDGNDKEYDTRFAGLFSVVRGAQVACGRSAVQACEP